MSRKGVAAVFAFVLFSMGIAEAKSRTSFTDGQAKSGQVVYAKNCAECHGADLQGFSGPKLVGAVFRAKYESSKELYDFVSTQMPLSAPASLSKKQYLDVTAFLLSKDGQKRGKKPSSVGK